MNGTFIGLFRVSIPLKAGSGVWGQHFVFRNLLVKFTFFVSQGTLNVQARRHGGALGCRAPLLRAVPLHIKILL